MQLFMDSLVLYKHVFLWDTLMANPIAGWQRGYGKGTSRTEAFSWIEYFCSPGWSTETRSYTCSESKLQCPVCCWSEWGIHSHDGVGMYVRVGHA